MRRILFGTALGIAALTGFAPRDVRLRDTVLLVSVDDAANGAFIPDAQVRIPSIGRVGRTKWDGEAYFGGLAKGRYRIQVRAIGFAPGDIDLPVSGDTAAVYFELERNPTSLDTTRVTATRPERNLKEFESRRREGIGRFITDSAIIEHRAQGLQLLLATAAPGIQIAGHSVVAAEPSLKGLGPCQILFYLDGFKLTTMPGGQAGSGPPNLDEFHMDELAGIEVYSRVSAPPQYKPSGDYCKVILLWTKW